MRLTRAKAFRQMEAAHVHSCVQNKSVDQLCALLKVIVCISTTCGIPDIYCKLTNLHVVTAAERMSGIPSQKVRRPYTHYTVASV